MRHISKILMMFGAALLLSSCMLSFDEIKPTDKVPGDEVWNDEAAIVGVMANMYNSLIFEDFSYFWGDYSWRSMDLVTMSDEGTAGFQKEPAFDQEGGVWEYPDEFLGQFIYIQGNQGGENIIRNIYSESYSLIRKCNEFIAKVGSSPLDSGDKEQFEGEARFLRAMAYFTLVKRFGGVPLIIEPQEYNGDVTALQVPRATEQQIWDFVISEAGTAAGMLPLTRTSYIQRANQGAAIALRCRAALYAGSIAKYGEVGFGKLTGIDASKANGYFAIAYQAAEDVIALPYYQLFRREADPTENYRMLFLTKENGEYIFQKTFDVASDIGNSNDMKHLPYSMCGWGSITPTLEMVEAYEMFFLFLADKGGYAYVTVISFVAVGPISGIFENCGIFKADFDRVIHGVFHSLFHGIGADIIFNVIGFIAFKINIGAFFAVFYGIDCGIRFHYYGEFGFSVSKAVFFAFGGFLNLFEIFYKFRVHLNILKGGENVFPFFFVGNNFVHKLAVVIFLGKFLFFRSFGNFRRF